MIIKKMWYLHLSLGVILFTPAYAKDVWDYARERMQHTEQPTPDYRSGSEVDPSRKEVAKPKEKSLKISPRSPNRRSSAVAKTSVVPEVKSVKEISLVTKIEPYEKEAIGLGRWLKKVIDTLGATPSEEQLRLMYHETKQTNVKLKEMVLAANNKLQLQQNNLQMIQRKLKELQSPSLPDDISRREVFAAGMATGYSLLELLEERKSFGIEINNEDFLAGIKEVISNGKRLSPDEFQTLLSGMNKKVHNAEQAIKHMREKNDAIWLGNFRKKNGASINKDGIWFCVTHKGDRKIESDETIFVSLSRKLSSDEIIFDSDINGEYIEMNINNSPAVLTDILSSINMHGEVVIAMPVNTNGKPDINSSLFEQWTLRIVDSGPPSLSASS